ncbi:RnfABCDGE type electron transport complex subunit B [Rhodoferax koreensis]|uniref:RnfABCDGE type electron transport complex subunit B n=1 Tax=Rhodoferax koreensis TaxID=1842727 RepID=UPI00194EBB5B|nr:RnfABCDGE type electron transport complex subunit B [Rhodoferax koreense]
MSQRASLAEAIDAVLPQTQCTRCGYPDCAAYARAVAMDEAGINQCPPGGADGVARLARLTGRPVLPLNPDHGLEQPRFMAVIDEAWCIGCTLCIAACPTDAIFGSNKLMHTVIEAHCTGCELCIPVCPVDCISLENASGARTGWAAWSDGDAANARQRYAMHRSRLEAQARTERPKREAVAAPSSEATADFPSADPKRAVIEAALARARAKRAAPPA